MRDSARVPPWRNPWLSRVVRGLTGLRRVPRAIFVVCSTGLSCELSRRPIVAPNALRPPRSRARQKSRRAARGHPGDPPPAPVRAAGARERPRGASTARVGRARTPRTRASKDAAAQPAADAAGGGPPPRAGVRGVPRGPLRLRGALRALPGGARRRRARREPVDDTAPRSRPRPAASRDRARSIDRSTTDVATKQT